MPGSISIEEPNTATFPGQATIYFPNQLRQEDHPFIGPLQTAFFLFFRVLSPLVYGRHHHSINSLIVGVHPPIRKGSLLACFFWSIVLYLRQSRLS